ncbi:DUF4361 domain-containing protein [Paludibacter sp.]
MKKIKFLFANLLLAFILLSGFTSCEEDIFNKELYEKIFSLLSDSEQVFNVVHPFEDGGSNRNLSIYCSGTKSIDEDVTIEIELDTDSLFKKYNEREHDLDSLSFAKKLDASRFQVASFTTTMKANQKDPYAAIPIKIDVNGLSPDSVYFIPLRIKSVSGNYKINPDKRNILYRPLLENRFASQNKTTYRSKGVEHKYRADGVKLETNYSEDFGATKIVYPISKTKVRVTLRHNVSLSQNGLPNRDIIEKQSLIIEVDENNKLTFTPYNANKFLYLIETLDPGDDIYYNNEFRVENGRDCFFLNFRYKEKTGSGKRWFKITERLRRDV